MVTGKTGNKFSEMMATSDALEHVAEYLAQEAAAFRESLDRDDYSAMVGTFDRVALHFQNLEKMIPAHWNVEPAKRLKRVSA